MTAALLKGEGDLRTERLTRIPCCECAEPATQRHTYLLPHARTNPASGAYGRDDCTWCADATQFTCDACETVAAPAGYEVCGTFYLRNRRTGVSNGLDHLFLAWRKVPREEDELGHPIIRAEDIP